MLWVCNPMVGAQDSGPGPTLCLSFDELDGQFVPDTSGSGTIACLGRNDTAEPTDPFWTDLGKFRGALEFDGQDDVLTIADSAAHAFGPTQSFTIEMWVKPLTEDTQATCDLASKSSAGAGYWAFRMQTRGRLGFAARGGGGKRTVSLLSAKNCLGSWHHIAFVRDRAEGMVRLFMDGELVTESRDRASPVQFNLRGPIILGGPRHFRGVLDELTFTRSAKRHFPLKHPPSQSEQDELGEYRPAKAMVEPPEPRIAASWRELDAHDLAIVPAPKRILLTRESFPIDDTWTIVAAVPGVAPGVAEFNRRITELGGRAVHEAGNAPGNAIVVGTFDTLQAYLPRIGNPPRPPRQGYVIRFARHDGKALAVVAGSDVDGARYGCITLSMLLQPGPTLPEASVDDWPDYKYRMGFNVRRAELARVRPAIDQAFRAKLNLVWGGGVYSTLEKMLASAEQRREVYEYAAERGIRVVIGNYFDVGPAPYPEDMAGHSVQCYPYKPEQGLIGHRGRAFTWSRDDLIDAKGDLVARFIRETGADVFYLHSMDTGHRDNPENWTHRTPMDRERWGNDRARADANLMGRIYAKMREASPDAMLFAVAYPYGASYLQYPDIRAWLATLSDMLPEDIYFCVREDTRENMVKWKESNRHGRFVYHAPYPSSMRLMFQTGGRYARTFYFDDRDVYWFLPSSDSLHWPHVWVAAEYAWNTKAPGWGWMPPDRGRMPVVDASPPEVDKVLLGCIARVIFGPAAAEAMRKVYAQKLSCRIASNLMSFTGAEPEPYFSAKAEAATRALTWVDTAKGTFSPSAEFLFPFVRSYVFNAKHLLASRFRYFQARRLLAGERYAAAQAAMAAARQELSRVSPEQYDAKRIAQDLDIAAAIKWRRERALFLRTVASPAPPIRIALYAGGFYEGVQESLVDVPGMRLELMEDPTRDALRDCDVLFFAAAGDVRDTTEDWRENLRLFVENGGGAVFTHNSVGRYPSSALGKPVFPEICAGYGGRLVDRRTLCVSAQHSAAGDLEPARTLDHEYADHLEVNPGPHATVVLENAEGHPVMVVGRVGKGRVVYTGQIFGITRDNQRRESVGDEWKLLYHLVHWAGTCE